MDGGLGMIELRRLVRGSNDEGISNLLGFMAAMIMLTASMATVVYFVLQTNDPAAEASNKEYDLLAVRALDTLIGSTGVPEDWGSPDGLGGYKLPLQAGLLHADRPETVSYDKLMALGRGDVAAIDVLDALDLVNEGVTIQLEGRPVSTALLEAPRARMQGVIHHSSVSSSMFTWVPDATSVADAQTFGAVNPEFEYEPHLWTFDWDTHPAKGVGNIHIDHPWFLETGLIPQMTGLTAVAAAWNNVNDTDLTLPYDDAYNRYLSTNELARWHIEQNDPAKKALNAFPTNTHLLAATYKGSGGGGGEGEWRSYEGSRTWAMFGPFDIAGANDVRLKFDTFRMGHDAVKNRTSVLYWNAVDGEWQRIRHNAACVTGVSNFDDEDIPEPPPVAVVFNAELDLCQARQNALGSLYLSFYWDSWCETGLDPPLEIACLAPKERHGAWFIDNIEITRTVGTNTEQIFHTDFEPPVDVGRHETLLLSSEVDYARYTLAPDDELVQDFIVDFVDSGGSIVALPPGTDGDWLEGIGLDPRTTSVGPSTVPDPSALLLRMPNQLPLTHAGYVTEASSWTDTASLDAAHLTPSGAAALLSGRPLGATKGGVSATSYELSTFSDEAVRDMIIGNLYAQGIFHDPTFSFGIGAPPEAGTSPVATAKRVVLVDATTDGRYAVPVELTMHLWPQQQGCPGGGAPPCT